MLLTSKRRGSSHLSSQIITVHMDDPGEAPPGLQDTPRVLLSLAPPSAMKAKKYRKDQPDPRASFDDEF